MADQTVSTEGAEGFTLDDPIRAACAVGSLVDAIETIAGVTVMVDLSAKPGDATIVAAEIVRVIEDLRSTANELEPSNEETDHA